MDKSFQVKNKDIEYMLGTDSESESISSNPDSEISISMKKERRKEHFPTMKNSRISLPTSGQEANKKINIGTRSTNKTSNLSSPLSKKNKKLNKKHLLAESDTTGTSSKQSMRALKLDKKVQRPTQNLNTEVGSDEEDPELKLVQRKKNVLSRLFAEKDLLAESDTTGSSCKQSTRALKLDKKVQRPTQNLNTEVGSDEDSSELELVHRKKNVLSRLFSESPGRKRKAHNDDNEIKRQKFEKNPPSIKLRLKVDSGKGGSLSWKLSNSEGSSSPSTKSQATFNVSPPGVSCEGSETPTKQSARKNLFSPEKSPKSATFQQSGYFTSTPDKKKNVDDSSSSNRLESPSSHKVIKSVATPKKRIRNELAANKVLTNKTPSKQTEDEQVLNIIPVEPSNENLVNKSTPKKKNIFYLTPQKQTSRSSIADNADDSKKANADDSTDDNYSDDELKETILNLLQRRTPLKEIASPLLRCSPRKINSNSIKGDSSTQVITSVSDVTLSATPKRVRSTSISKSMSETLNDNNTTPLKKLDSVHLTSEVLKNNALSNSPVIVLNRIIPNENSVRNKTPLKTIKESPKNERNSPKNTRNISGICNSKINYKTLTPVKNIIPQGDKSNLLSSKCGDVASKLKEIASPVKSKDITVITPVSKKKEGRGFLTPHMAKRNNEAIDATDSPLDITRKQLHISTVPKYLPCRDSEFSQIKTFLLRKIEHSAGGCMYISGVPGTGKTATVHAVIRALREDVSRGDLQEFDFVEVNGLRLTEPRQAYVRIYQALTNQKLTPDQAQQLLNKRFSSMCKKSTIILVDELDYLCNRRQDVVYNILDWPSKRSSALVVLTISNTMDLPERTLKGRVTSRMGLTRLTFQPYTHHQLKEIVQDRLSGSSTFHPDAVQLVARKVAAVSGDARRALDVCRRTTELVQDKEEQITVSHVEKALVQLCATARVQVIRALSGLGQMVLRSVRDVCQRTGVDETSAASVYQHLRQLTLLEGIPVPSPGALLEACVNLVRLGLLVAEKGRVDLTRKMSLNVSSDDIHFALDNSRS